MTTTGDRRRVATGPAGPGARDVEADTLAAGCTRFLAGHGPRRADRLLAMIPPTTEVDVYGAGGVVAELEAEVAALLGKEAALFVPSGTMAQQAVLRVHAERRGRRTVVFHPACHLETHEERAYQRLHGLYGLPVGGRHEPLTAAALAGVSEPVAALLVELPQRDLGGFLPSWRELQAQVAWARRQGAATHLDGARLWESTPRYRRSPAQIAGLFDTVYVSFYKGLGGIAGCCVAGDADIVAELAVWRTRHGGRLFALWPYAASALTALRTRLPSMPTYYRHAVAVAAALRDLPGVEVLPDPPHAPMMHLRLAVGADELRERALGLARTEGIWTWPRPFASDGERLQRVELSVGDATLTFEPAEVRRLVEHLVTPPPRPARRSTKPSTAARPRPRR